MDKTLLLVNGVSCITKDGVKLHDINLSLIAGELHVLVGQNDAGQKALLSSLLNHELIIDGDIELFGNEFTSSILTLSQNGFKILNQANNLVDYATVGENIFLDELPRRSISGFINWKRIWNDTQKIIDDFNIDISPKEIVKNLSKEKRQLVRILKTFSNQPQAVIMYDPTHNLSADSVSKLYAYIKKYQDNGGTILYISTTWEEAIKIGDRISVLSDGTIIGPITSSQARNNPRKFLKMLGHYSLDNVQDYVEDSEFEQQRVLESVFKAAELLTSEYELKDVLLFLAKSVAEVMKSDESIITLLDYNTKSVINHYEYIYKESLNAELKTSFLRKFFSQKLLYYSNVNDKEFKSLFEKTGQCKTIISVPLTVRNHVAGIITILYKNVYIHSSEESKYLMAFAQQSAISIEDTRLIGRSALLQESHHRIKNNLQAISSFITLQKMHMNRNPEITVSEILDNITSRIKGVAALHDLMSKDELARSIINIKDLVKVVVDYTLIDETIEIRLDIIDLFISYSKATSISLLINEIVTNSAKYAFQETHIDKKIISISIDKEDDKVIIRVKDNGPGYPDNILEKNQDSIGFNIISSIVKNELHGTLEISNDHGARIDIVLDLSSIYLSNI